MEFVTNEPRPADEKPIVNTPFWLDIDVSDLRETMRINNDITPKRLRLLIQNEVAEVNAELWNYREQQMQHGYKKLSDVPAETVDGVSVLLIYYKIAVYNRVKSRVLEKYRDVDLTNSGNKKAADMDETIDEFNRNASWAISNIHGRPHVTVSLI